MNHLVFDTSTEVMSVAVRHGERVRAWRGAGGAQASDRLIPCVLELLDELGLRLADLDVIAFGQGPGAFTGLRGACAVAQGLAFGAGKPVLPIGSLLAVAEAARQQTGATQVLAVLDARMNEVYSAVYEYQPSETPGTAGTWQEVSPVRVGPAGALAWPVNAAVSDWTVVGNAFAGYADQMPAPVQAAARVTAVPDAECMLALIPGLLAQGLAVPADQAMPVYVRDKVADTTAERAALAAAKLARA
ncbi:tRNA (adenosine(37)-N6)-threonylcarbamoyltransferase complex dimerization subunit type 1 TsaB [Comamonas serinivorans]|uniref:tRNA (Adenosine(37)-N6)-threonylcarbamoyltransferase complex dimerization subunit type 1 TsaB n=1 Tax=Comamonas serinivorans TaxID=1082851 RepID=A0A1Y0EJ64_9BURK|nr:tRNA (adenosine(37)-N6)-threonylcarbamoyltransferase complex dimerization subunit type 1 TsaB [Comamonas serinivorans]ARU03468.1 tRNA (adenosine(37)-N6)-threonylcarbamoyltransferase complex dimerization subunit type 1 TsaB [Comamonas serinivorans]